MSLLDDVAALFGVVTTARDHDAATETLQVTDEEGPRSGVVDLGLAGFYSLARSGVKGLIARTRAGGYLLRAWTAPPTDAAPGECGIYLNNATVRVRPDGRVDVIGGDLALAVEIDTTQAAGVITLGRNTLSAVRKVARDTDPVQIDAASLAFLAWLAGVDAYVRFFVPGLPPVPAIGTRVGTVAASTAKTFSG